MDHDLGMLKDGEFNNYAQLVLNRDMSVCYINEMVQKLLRGIKCGDRIDKYAQIDDFSRATNVVFPFQTILRCEKGVFMCMISEISANRKDYYNVSIAYSADRGERGLHAFLCSKLAIMNLQSIIAKRSHNFRRTEKQVEYISSFFDYQAQKAMMIKALMCANAVLTRKREVENTQIFLNNIAKLYCDAMDYMKNNQNERDCKKDEKTEGRVIVDCDPREYITVDPIFSMATVYLTDAMFSISGTGYITLSAEKFGAEDIIIFKTNVGKKTYNSINSLSENLTDKSESPFFRMFFGEVISKYTYQAPQITTNKSEVTVKLFLPKKPKEYILRCSLTTTRRFNYLDNMFAAVGLGDLNFKIHTLPNPPSETDSTPE